MRSYFQNIRSDFPASIVVFFVALPLCLGIALASGAPLFSGLISGVIGGVIVGIISGSRLGVSGPAAGLAVLVLGYIEQLGGSFEAFLMATIIAGIIQVAAGFLRLGSIAYYFPSSVIKGMLSGIGILIIFKQLPYLLGEFDKIDFTISSPQIALISLVSIASLILWDLLSVKNYKFFKLIPGPLFVVFLGIVLGDLLAVESKNLVQIPVSTGLGDFLNNLKTPDFSQILNPKIYSIAVIIAVVASLETLLCVEATDKLDPQKRVTPANLELKAQGFGNIASGLIGGLPITQVVVRSSANIEFGAKSKASTILHGLLIAISAITIPNLLNMIPLASLACILVMVGYKLAKPKIFKDVFSLGFEQFAPFIVTIIFMIFFDLLKGVGAGMVVAIAFILLNNFKNAYSHVAEIEGNNKTIKIILSEEVSFLNKGKILQLLNDIPNNSKVTIDASKCSSIHYDIIEIISDFKGSCSERNIQLETKGLKKLIVSSV